MLHMGYKVQRSEWQINFDHLGIPNAHRNLDTGVFILCHHQKLTQMMMYLILCTHSLSLLTILVPKACRFSEPETPTWTKCLHVRCPLAEHRAKVENALRAMLMTGLYFSLVRSCDILHLDWEGHLSQLGQKKRRGEEQRRFALSKNRIAVSWISARSGSAPLLLFFLLVYHVIHPLPPSQLCFNLAYEQDVIGHVSVRASRLNGRFVTPATSVP